MRTAYASASFPRGNRERVYFRRFTPRKSTLSRLPRERTRRRCGPYAHRRRGYRKALAGEPRPPDVRGASPRGKITKTFHKVLAPRPAVMRDCQRPPTEYAFRWSRQQTRPGRCRAGRTGQGSSPYAPGSRRRSPRHSPGAWAQPRRRGLRRHPLPMLTTGGTVPHASPRAHSAKRPAEHAPTSRAPRRGLRLAAIAGAAVVVASLITATPAAAALPPAEDGA